MARQVVILDDLDGSPDAEEIEFAWGGTNLTIDLSQKNYKKLEELLRPYLDAARPRMAATDAERQAPKRQRTAKAEGEKIDYASLEHAGEPHRGRVSPEEAKIVQENFDEVNKRLSEAGMRMIDPADAKMKERYGLSA